MNTGTMLGKFEKMIDSVGLLDLFDYPFKSDDLKLLESDYSMLSTTLRNNTNSFRQVTALRFGHTSIDDALVILSNALRSPHCTLEKIQFVHNDIGPEGAGEIAESLKVNRSLTSLEIIDDHIALEGSRALAEVLLSNPVLSSLILQNNSISSGAGVDCISEALRVNSTLRVLE
jgi:hypothetical protein